MDKSGLDKNAEQIAEFLQSQKSLTTGLIQSYNGSSPYLYDSIRKVFELRDTGYLDNQAFTYDLALSVIAFSLIKDFKSAADILGILENNFHQGKYGKIGLFNSYKTDRFINEWKELALGIDGDRIHAGPNLWVGISSFHYSIISGDIRFFPLCVEIIKWAIHRLNHFTFADGQRGGISMGYGWGPDWSRTFSTENNVDYYALLRMMKSGCNAPALKRLIESSGLLLNEIQNEMKSIERWLKEVVYDPDEKLLYVGFNESGLDKTKALDTATFTILGIGPQKLNELDIPPDVLIHNVEKYFRAEDVFDGRKIMGFDFTDPEGCGRRRQPVIWVEGTYQMILTYQMMAFFYEKNRNASKAQEYSEKANQLSDCMEYFIEFINRRQKIPSYTSINPSEQEIFMTFKQEWEIQRGRGQAWVSAVASAIWRLLALSRFNPMSVSPFFLRTKETV